MMTLSPLESIYRHRRPGRLYMGGVGIGSVLSDDSGLAWLSLTAVSAAFDAPSATSFGGMRITMAGGHASGANAYAIPAGQTSLAVEMAVSFGTPPSTVVDLVRWGADAAALRLTIDPSASVVQLAARGAVALQAPFTVAKDKLHHVAADMGEDGACRIYSDGAWTTSTTAAPPPAALPGPADLLLLSGAPVGATMVLAAIYPAPLVAADIEACTGMLARMHHIAGYAALADGTAATAVAMRRMLDGLTVAVVAPASDGSFDVVVPGGDYDVVCYGPAGYLPEVYGPISAQPVS